MSDSLGTTVQSLEELQRASAEIKSVLTGLGRVAPQMQEAAQHQLEAAARMSDTVQAYMNAASQQADLVSQAMTQFGSATGELRDTVQALAEQLQAAGVARRRRQGQRILGIIPTPWRKQAAATVDDEAADARNGTGG
jgi:methyl-accepting chemotaxis protein